VPFVVNGNVSIAHAIEREMSMENVSVLHRVVTAPALPGFVATRVDRFHNERVAIDWGGRHILRGRRPAGGDLMLQSNDYLAIAGHPAIVEAQIQSGIVYGMSTVTKLGITLDKGRVVQKNFNNYDPIRIDEMPVVEVHIVPSHENPGGIGEASTPSIVPAVVNAVYAATKKRVRMLPIKAADLV